MLESIKKHFNKTELLSVLQTFVSVVAIDAIAEWHNVLAGDWSKTALLSLGAALVRSLLKAAWMVFSRPQA